MLRAVGLEIVLLTGIVTLAPFSWLATVTPTDVLTRIVPEADCPSVVTPSPE